MRPGRVVEWILALALVIATSGAFAADVEPRIALPGHTLSPDLVAAARPIPKADAATPEAPMLLTIVLRRVDEAGFERFLAELYDRESPNFRKFLSPQAVSDRFGPDANAYDAVAGYFASEGFTIVEGSANRMTLLVSGSRAQAERTLAVTLDDFELDRKRYVANDREPSLPASVAKHVQAVLGLSDLASARRMGAAPVPLWANNPNTPPPPRCTPDPNNDPLGLGANICNAFRDRYVGFVGAIYNAFCGLFWNWGGLCKKFTDPTPPPSPDRAIAVKDAPPQRIGLAQFDSFRMSDVADFLALVNAPASAINRLSSVAVDGGAPLGPNQAEVLLDINAAMATATEAQVVVYSAPFRGAGSFQAIFNRMATDGVTVISNSWGYCENQTTLADAQSIDSILASAAASGISMFSAAGDTGSTCLNGAPNTIILPASAPHATAVGGTSVVIGPGDSYAGETWWAGKGGFGVSQFFPRPAYQNGFTASATRSIPDLSLNADPAAYGIQICQADAGGCPTGLFYGGTSASAPFMAGMMALINQGRGANSGWLNPQIYPRAGTPAFHSPASMGSDFAHVGLGSPNVSQLVLALGGGTLGPATAAKSRVGTDAPQIYADGIALANVTVQLRDAGGFSVAGKTISLAKNGGSSATITTVNAVTSQANGTAFFTVKNLIAQESTFTATNVTDGFVVTETVTITSVAPPAASASINAFPTSVLNDGTATTTITVTLQDALGRPSPGKQVTLSQGSGHSIISGPSPSVTNASGQIVFTATNRFAETVVYTAVDVTDGDLPVPGSATVDFTGSPTNSCVGPAPLAAPGFVLTPFATGFVAEAFNYSNINFGCAGASNPAFDGNGVLIGNFRTGELFRLPAEGGAASSGDKLSTPGLTIGAPTYGKDGRLYVTRAATGSFFSGNILELDPVSGATLRVVVSNLNCPGPLGVDPISGDLFYGGTCFGAGTDDARLLRVRNPGSTDPLNPPTVVDYATLPGTPNGAVAIAPDGTIYVATQYLAARTVVRVSGTNQPQPATVTAITGLASIFWVTIGETLQSGAARSLIILGTDNKLKLADITVSPPTFTELTQSGISSGTIGPDGCLYPADSTTVYKLTPASGICGFTPTSAAPSLRLTPAAVAPSPAQGTTLTFTAQFANLSVPVNTPVVFSSYGSNAQVLLGRTDASRAATASYLGRFVGSEVLVAKATVGGIEYVSNAVEITWGAGKHVSFLSLNDSPTAGTAGIPSTLRATLTDAAVTPAVPIAGATIQFTLGSQSCNAATNGSGVASCSVTPPAAGSYAMAATYAGNASYLPAAAAQSFVATGPPTTTLATSMSPVPVGTSFTLTATVTGTAPTGTVSFRNELAPLPNCSAVPLVGAGNSRTAQCTVNSLGVGSFALTADYSGDGSNFPSTATIVQVISANAAPACGGFSDVDPTSAFCPNVEWLRNRQVTLGCIAGLYCPNDVVFRLQMAAFMNRLGTAGTDLVLSAQAQPGAIDLDTSTVVCQTTDFAVVNFPRRAIVDAILSGQGAANVSFVAEAVASFDAGVTWAPLAGTAVAGSAASGNWGNVRAAGARDLDVGQSVRFGLRVSRGGLPGAGGLSAGRCNVRAQIGNRVTGYSPLDP